MREIRCLEDGDFGAKSAFFKRDVGEHARKAGFESISDFLYVCYYEEFWSLRYLSSTLCYSSSAVKRCLLRMNIRVRGAKEKRVRGPSRAVGRPSRFGAEETEEMRRMRGEGASFGQIASVFGCSRTCVFNNCKKGGKKG